MAYKRRSSYRAKRAKRPRRSGASFGTLAITALKGYALNKLKQKLGLNTENKFVDVTGAATVSTTLTNRIAGPTIPTGSAIGERNGASVRISRVDTRVCMYLPALATTACNVRIIQVRNSHGNNATVGDVLEVTTELASPINNEARDNGLQILKDVVINVPTANGGPGVTLEWSHVGLTDHMIWPDSDTLGTPAAAIKGVIQTFWFADNITTSPVVTAKSRYWFVDN